MTHSDFIHVWPFEVDREELTGKTEEENPGIESVGPILIDNSIDLMREAVRGNGIEPQAVQFNSFTGTVLHFETYQVFKVAAKTGEKYLPGRQQGVAVGSRQDARNKVMAMVENAATNIDVHRQTIKFLKQRLDLGFSVEGWSIRFDGMKRAFVVHEKCPTCSGLGKNSCPDCKGTRKRPCKTCQGSKLMVCTGCKGKKQFLVKGKAPVKSQALAKGKAPAKIQPAAKQVFKKCKKCAGVGKVRCTACQGSGGTRCLTCQASGKTGCKPCVNTGWRSHITFMEVSAKCRFSYDKEALPPEVPPLIDKLRARMLTDKHAHIKINEDLTRKRELDNLHKPQEFMMRKPDEFAITYDVRLPWGDIGYNWEPRTEPVTGKLFGFRPSLVHMQPFLEEIALPGIRAVGEAATSAKNVSAKLHEAIRFRIMGDTLLAAARFGQGRAVEAVLQRYPFGVGYEKMQEIVSQAHLALKFLTQSSRAAGLLAGLALTAAMDAGLWLGSGHTLVTAYIPDVKVQAVLELAPIPAAIAVTIFCIKGFSKKALFGVLGKVLPQKGGKTEKLGPRAGLAALIDGLGGVALYAGILAVAIMHFGVTMPDWLEQAQRALKIQR